MTIEQWRPVVDFDHYRVSDHGNVCSIDRVITTRSGEQRHYRGRPLTLIPTTTGYLQVNLRRNGQQFPSLVHVLVARAFIGERPSVRHEVCHINGDGRVNYEWELYWGTRGQNISDTIRHGRHNHKRKIRCVHGHLLRSPNLTAASIARGWRKCIACERAHIDVHRNSALAFRQRADIHYQRIMTLPDDDLQWRPGLDGQLGDQLTRCPDPGIHSIR